jgi:hypothetical protein
MILKGTGYDVIDWINLAQDRVQRRGSMKDREFPEKLSNY